MATYQPPSDNLPIFDPLVFSTGDEALTYNKAIKIFLKYPNAQGAETLQAITVNGTSTFNDNITQNGDNLINQTNISNNTTINTFKASQIYGDLNLRRPTGGNGGAFRLWDVGSVSGNSTQQYHSGNLFQIKNLVNQGKIYIWNLDNTGADAQTLTLAGETGGKGYVGINNTSPQYELDVLGRLNVNQSFIKTSFGNTTSPTLELSDTTTSRLLYFVMNSSNNAYNPFVNSGDLSIIASGNNAPLNLSIQSSTTTGLKVGLTSVLLGSGGTADTPTNNINIDGSTNAISINCVNPPTSNAVQPAFNDSSTKIPTTAWVQGAISATPVVVPANLTPNSVNITPTTYPSTGLFNYYNTGATRGYNFKLTPTTYTMGALGNQIMNYTSPIKIDFISTSGLPTLNEPVLLSVEWFFYAGSNYGSSKCDMLVFPTFNSPSNWGLTSIGGQDAPDGNYCINNMIGGATGTPNSSFTLAGRQYWTYNQAFSGPSLTGFLACKNISATQQRLLIYLASSSINTTTWTCNVTIKNAVYGQNLSNCVVYLN